MWTAYFSWAKLDPAAYVGLPLPDRIVVLRHTLPNALAFHFGRPARKRIRQRLPAWMLFRSLELVSMRRDGLGWFRAPDRRSARHLADVQPDRTREGHAILREGELLLLNRRGHILALVIKDEEESSIQFFDGKDWH